MIFNEIFVQVEQKGTRRYHEMSSKFLKGYNFVFLTKDWKRVIGGIRMEIVMRVQSECSNYSNATNLLC